MVKARRSGRRFFQVRCGALFSSFLARPRRLQSWAAITRALPPGRCWARNPSATYVLTTSARAVSSAPLAERPTVRGRATYTRPHWRGHSASNRPQWASASVGALVMRECDSCSLLRRTGPQHTRRSSWAEATPATWRSVHLAPRAAHSLRLPVPAVCCNDAWVSRAVQTRVRRGLGCRAWVRGGGRDRGRRLRTVRGPPPPRAWGCPQRFPGNDRVPIACAALRAACVQAHGRCAG